MKKPLDIHYTVMVDDEELDRLYREGKAEGSAYDDAGPVLTAKRWLMDVGLEGAFSGEHHLGLEFTLHHN